jgi:hypothetical protein
VPNAIDPLSTLNSFSRTAVHLFALSPAPFLDELKKKIDNREIDIVDAAEEDDYIVNMRRG